MADIFLSYAHEDEDRAQQLRQALEGEGWSVWWDRTLLAGASFKQEIVEEIQAARCLIPLWSSSAVESVWVKAETVQAWPRLVPVLLEKDLLIPEPFDNLNAVDLSTWDAGDPLPGTLLESITAKVPPQKPTAKPAVDNSVLLDLVGDPDRVAATISKAVIYLAHQT